MLNNTGQQLLAAAAAVAAGPAVPAAAPLAAPPIAMPTASGHTEEEDLAQEFIVSPAKSERNITSSHCIRGPLTTGIRQTSITQLSAG